LTAGLTVGQASGLWVTGAGTALPTVQPGLSLLQLSGVWITGAGGAIKPKLEMGGGYQALNDDEEILTIITAFLHMVKK